MTTIYIVQGSRGEFSDHCEWLIKAFTSEERAQALVLAASAKDREIRQWIENDGDAYDDYDPEYWEWFTESYGNNYQVLTVELVEGDEEPNG